MKYCLTLLAVALLFVSCKQESKPATNKLLVIFETDMGNDIDDALALDMLYKYSDQGLIRLLGIGVNKQNDYSPQYIDLLNTWYGYPAIPIGFVTNGVEDSIPVNFAKAAVEYTNHAGQRFDRTLTSDHQFEEAVQFYRRTLAAQPDTSVTIISVGFLTNLANLLDSKADENSPLSGIDLINRKVKKLALMGGNFDGSNPTEYNIVKDVKASTKVFELWPTSIVISPFEVGAHILFPSVEIEKNLNYTIDQPVVVGYKSYLPMPYDRPTWDLTSVLEAVVPSDSYFSYSTNGRVSVEPDGRTTFVADEKGKHYYLLVNEEQRTNVLQALTDLISNTKSKNQ